MMTTANSQRESFLFFLFILKIILKRNLVVAKCDGLFGSTRPPFEGFSAGN